MAGPGEGQTAAQVVAPVSAEEVERGFFERLTAPGGILDQSWTWIEIHWADLAWGVPSILLTLAVVELTKPFVKLGVKKLLGDSYSDTIENALIRLYTLIPAALWCWVLDFQSAWGSLTGKPLSFGKAMAVGVITTAALTIALVHVLNYFRVLETLRVRWRRFTKVSKKDLDDNKTTKGHEPISAEAAEADRKARELPEQ